MKDNVTSLVLPAIRGLTAYVAAEVPCAVKLDANESPHRPGRALMKKIAARTEGLELNRYPDPEARELRKLLARRLRVPVGSILLGNGSDELIAALVTTFGGPILYPVPTFAMYGILGTAQGARTVEVPLDRNFDLPMAPIRRAFAAHRPKIVFLSSPNNPTGNVFSEGRIRSVVKESGGVVVVDEAYQPFSRQRNWLAAVRNHPNLVVLRTLSKVGLAGIRLGILVAAPEIVAEVNKVRLPYNVNAFSQAAALTVLEDRGNFLRTSARAVTGERRRMGRRLAGIAGIRVFPSDANFLFFSVADPDRVFTELLKRGVLIRNLGGTAQGGMRVTVGSRRDNDRFLRELEEVMR